MARDESLQSAVEMVRNLIRTCWRASSLVEGINSVVRMQQARHRKMTAGLIDLKRFYWNCRRFRTGRRKNRSPYELLGIQLPIEDWWELLKLGPGSNQGNRILGLGAGTLTLFQAQPAVARQKIASQRRQHLVGGCRPALSS